MMQHKVAIQLQLLVCHTIAIAGIQFGKDTFNELGCWQNYTNRKVYIKQLPIQHVSAKSSSDTTL